MSHTKAEFRAARRPRGIDLRPNLADLLPPGWGWLSRRAACGPEGHAIGRTTPEAVAMAQAQWLARHRATVGE